MIIFVVGHCVGSILKDELLGLAEDSDSDPVFQNRYLNMDVIYRTGETHQVKPYIMNNQVKSLFNTCFLSSLYQTLHFLRL